MIIVFSEFDSSYNNIILECTVIRLYVVYGDCRLQYFKYCSLLVVEYNTKVRFLSMRNIMYLSIIVGHLVNISLKLIFL